MVVPAAFHAVPGSVVMLLARFGKKLKVWGFGMIEAEVGR
jgi:hypothetical protein